MKKESSNDSSGGLVVPGTKHRTRFLRETSLVSRRDFFSSVADGLHAAALAYLFGIDLLAPGGAQASPIEKSVPDLRPKLPHFAPKAKAVIQLFMNGGPSQVDLFDPKPLLRKYEGQPASRSGFLRFSGPTNLLKRLDGYEGSPVLPEIPPQGISGKTGQDWTGPSHARSEAE